MKRLARFLDSWTLNEQEPTWAAVIGATAVLVLFGIVVYLYVWLFAPMGAV